MRFERARALETARPAARALQLALCAAALVTMAIKFFVVAFVVVAACLGMLVAAVDGFPHWFFARRHHGVDHDDTPSPSRLSRLLTKYCPYSKRQTTDMLLALLLLAAAVAFLASDTMDNVCDVASSTSTIEKAADAADAAIDSLGLGGGSDESASSGSSADSDDTTSVGCAAAKASVGCALVAALLFLVTIALTCPPFAQRSGLLEDGERVTEADSGKPSSENHDPQGSERGTEYHRLDGGSPHSESTPTHGKRRQ